MEVQGLFSALADDTRRRVFECLAAGGPATATELSRRIPVSRQAIAKHLDVLARAGLVDRHRQGREVRFEARPDQLDDVIRWALDVGAEWDDRLSRLRRRME